MNRRNLPIAFFDSGVGGLSVLREAVRMMPREDYLYFGDSVNAPYGTRPVEEIRTLTLRHIGRMYAQGIKAVTVACNTATSAAIRQLREKYQDIPVIGIEPALKPAAEIGDHPRVIVMATPLTVRAQKFSDLLAGYEDRADVTALACPGLMEFVEDGSLDSPEVVCYLRQLLDPYLEREKVDAIVLGCTHYPFLKDTIRTIAGPDVCILDGGEGTARELKRRLEDEDLLTDRNTAGTVIYDESIPDKIALCRKLMALPF